jgi:hypothetical protein
VRDWPWAADRCARGRHQAQGVDTIVLKDGIDAEPRLRWPVGDAPAVRAGLLSPVPDVVAVISKERKARCVRPVRRGPRAKEDLERLAMETSLAGDDMF